MKRRKFITLLATAATSPLAALAQQPMPVIGYLSYAPQSDTWRTAAFLQGLEETGYVANQNVSIENRWAESQIDRLPALATDLVYHQTAVIAAVGGTLRHLPPRRRLRRFQSSSFSALTLFNPV